MISLAARCRSTKFASTMPCKSSISYKNTFARSPMRGSKSRGTVMSTINNGFPLRIRSTNCINSKSITKSVEPVELIKMSASSNAHCSSCIDLACPSN